MKTDNRAPPYSMRLSAELRARLEEAAKIAGRSLHSEISLRLESTFNDELPPELSIHTAGDVLRQALKEQSAHAGNIPTNGELFRMLEELRGRVDDLERRNR